MNILQMMTPPPLVKGIFYNYIFCCYNVTYFDFQEKYKLVHEGIVLYAELYNALKLLVINNVT